MTVAEEQNAIKERIISLLEEALNLVDDSAVGTSAAPHISYAIDILKEWDQAKRHPTAVLQST